MCRTQSRGSAPSPNCIAAPADVAPRRMQTPMLGAALHDDSRRAFWARESSFCFLAANETYGTSFGDSAGSLALGDGCPVDSDRIQPFPAYGWVDRTSGEHSQSGSSVTPRPRLELGFVVHTEALFTSPLPIHAPADDTSPPHPLPSRTRGMHSDACLSSSAAGRSLSPQRRILRCQWTACYGHGSCFTHALDFLSQYDARQSGRIAEAGMYAELLAKGAEFRDWTASLAAWRGRAEDETLQCRSSVWQMRRPNFDAPYWEARGKGDHEAPQYNWRWSKEQILAGISEKATGELA
ncbi:hypothetical protein B0H17DRAFT_1129820 [Mycena rosella]|uniref:Uncharacterized protein n=1 Tax=Mycena rosella TaxID=1033263 RepID=A0AAD7DUE6_MYCRO|nr:hypothetical protein B0H17DRAFT_1129820 [Mycena rosella]